MRTKLCLVCLRNRFLSNNCPFQRRSKSQTYFFFFFFVRPRKRRFAFCLSIMTIMKHQTYRGRVTMETDADIAARSRGRTSYHLHRRVHESARRVPPPSPHMSGGTPTHTSHYRAPHATVDRFSMDEAVTFLRELWEEYVPRAGPEYAQDSKNDDRITSR